MNDNNAFSAAEIQDLLKDVDTSFLGYEAAASYYGTILNNALALTQDLRHAKQMIVKVFENKATRMILVNAVAMAGACTDEYRTLGVSNNLCLILVDLSKIA